ncbi:MAG: ADP-ribosylglycohydrolase family protein [Mogibacterium sp.]|nr:ADP-ribosylglycohydrolase family protein [Mogibacterium sp.]
MYGAILGDIIGSPYEFDRGNKTKGFPFFNKGARFTDDSVMTIAVADALIQAKDNGVIDDEAATKELLIDSMHMWGHKYPNAGYGGRFYQWLKHSEREPYGSWGNGSAMRVSAAGWLYDDLETTRRVARWTAEVTHNHPEGVKGAEATAAAIWMGRNGKSKEEIKNYIVKEFGYDLSRTCDEIRPDYYHVESCQQTVPEAITAFLEGNDFEDVIRTAVSLGGDCDTLTCIAGAIAEAFYKVPAILRDECEERLPKDMQKILLLFIFTLGRNAPYDPMGDSRIDRYENFYESITKNTIFKFENMLSMSPSGSYIQVEDIPENNVIDCVLGYNEHKDIYTISKETIDTIKDVIRSSNVTAIKRVEFPNILDGDSQGFYFKVGRKKVALGGCNLWAYRSDPSTNAHILMTTADTIIDLIEKAKEG